MRVEVFTSKLELGRKASELGASLIREAIEKRGAANLILATGVSQFEMLDRLVQDPDIDWSKVVAFHLDEYVGLPLSHPASFRKYLKERFADRVPVKKFHYIDGEGDADAECQRLENLIRAKEIDVAFVGIGENGHLAFNDPPADFETEAAYIVVELDGACRKQQVGEGWFKSLDEVPGQAISMTIPEIMRAQAIICACPDARKAAAVKTCLEGPVTPEAPASILQRHPRAVVLLDRESAALLTNRT